MRIWFEDTATNKLPSGYNHDYMGEARQYVTEGSALYATFGLALAIIFLVLAIQFESLKDPLVIMVSVPPGDLWCPNCSSLGCGNDEHLLTSRLDHAGRPDYQARYLICGGCKECKKQLHHHKTRIEAVMEAAKVRLRPILMTTAAMIAGLIPLMYAKWCG
ncbi:efflux RND transporter permease subunit [Vibrio chagasii]|nr:efflux RND transporter permease subunit [Vibrio chagasii]